MTRFYWAAGVLISIFGSWTGGEVSIRVIEEGGIVIVVVTGAEVEVSAETAGTVVVIGAVVSGVKVVTTALFTAGAGVACVVAVVVAWTETLLAAS